MATTTQEAIFYFFLFAAICAFWISTLLTGHMTASLIHKSHLMSIPEGLKEFDKLYIYLKCSVMGGLFVILIIYVMMLHLITVKWATNISHFVRWFCSEAIRGLAVRYALRILKAMGSHYTSGNALVESAIGSFYVGVVCLSILLCKREERVSIATEVMEQSFWGAAYMHYGGRDNPWAALHCAVPYVFAAIARYVIPEEEYALIVIPPPATLIPRANTPWVNDPPILVDPGVNDPKDPPTTS